jgi:hypothetical protein
MANSLNGWPAIPTILNKIDPRLRTITIPGTKRQVTVRRGAAPLFAAFLADWQKEMPARLKLDVGPIGGYVYRESRFNPKASGLSNHASGTAVDVRWDVLLADNKRHMTAAETAILKKILSRYVTKDGHHVLANGYLWHTCDEMHTELSQGWDYGAKRYTTMADVNEVVGRLKIDKNGVRRAGV